MVREFASNGKVFVYDFDDTDIYAICLARELWLFQNEQLMHPPATLDDLESSPIRGADCLALAYILQKREADGSLKPFDAGYARRDVLSFVRSLKGGNFKRLEECKRDFFTKAELFNVESTMRREHLSKTAMSLYSAQVQALQAMKTANGDTPTTTIDSPDSISTENSIDDSAKPEMMR